MCTATWISTDDGYVVFFNRDELSTRKTGLPPRLRESRGVRFVAPEDGDAGGTWLGVNELGVTVGLANGPRGAHATIDRPFRSRGLLVLDLLPCGSVEEVGRELARLATEAPYRSFELFAIAPRDERGGAGRAADAEAHVWSWDGRALARRAAAGSGALMISSSRDFARARSEREALLARLLRERGRLDEELLASFHSSHEPERGPWSPCMHRDDASTVSESRIRVGRDEVSFAYAAGSPCEQRGEPARTVLARRSRS